jgi:hypothetical protein
VVSTDELPSTVKSLNDSWLSTYQSSTVVVRRFYHLDRGRRGTFSRGATTTTRPDYSHSSRCNFFPSSKTTRISTEASKTARCTRSSYSPISRSSSPSARQLAGSSSRTSSARFPCVPHAKATPYSRACSIAARWTSCRAMGPSALGYGSCGIVSAHPFSIHASVLSLSHKKKSQGCSPSLPVLFR